jgi:hypothetical protein
MLPVEPPDAVGRTASAADPIPVKRGAEPVRGDGEEETVGCAERPAPLVGPDALRATVADTENVAEVVVIEATVSREGEVWSAQHRCPSV